MEHYDVKSPMDGKFVVSIKQIKILYNLEYYKVLDDIGNTIKSEAKKALKEKWLKEWQDKISNYFTQLLSSDEQSPAMEWLSKDDLFCKIEEEHPEKVWFRLMLIELVLFEPYFILKLDKDKYGNNVPCKVYNGIKPLNSSFSDKFLTVFFSGKTYFSDDYIKRIRNSYKKVSGWLGDVLKEGCTSVPAGNYVCKECFPFNNSYFITTEKTMAILGGGAALYIGLNSFSESKCLIGIENSIGRYAASFESLKLLISVKEVFFNDEKDIDYVKNIYEMYRQELIVIEKQLIDIKAEEEISSREFKKDFKERIKNVESGINIMTITKKHIRHFIESYKG